MVGLNEIFNCTSFVFFRTRRIIIAPRTWWTLDESFTGLNNCSWTERMSKISLILSKFLEYKQHCYLTHKCFIRFTKEVKFFILHPSTERVLNILIGYLDTNLALQKPRLSLSSLHCWPKLLVTTLFSTIVRQLNSLP